MRKFLLSVLSVAAFLGAFTFTINTEHVQATGDENVVQLNEQNSVILDGPVEYRSIGALQEELVELIDQRGSKKYPIFISIISPGGSVSAGLALYELLKGFDNVHFLMFQAYSMGAVLPQLHKGKRLVVQSSEIMMHRIKYVLRQSMDSEDITRLLDGFKDLEDDLENRIAERSALTIDEYRARTSKDWFMNAKRAVQFGFADKIVTVKCSIGLIKAKRVIVMNPLPGLIPAVEIEKSQCPLML